MFPSKLLFDHCLLFLVGRLQVPRNNACIQNIGRKTKSVVAFLTRPIKRVHVCIFIDPFKASIENRFVLKISLVLLSSLDTLGQQVFAHQSIKKRSYKGKDPRQGNAPKGTPRVIRKCTALPTDITLCAGTHDQGSVQDVIVSFSSSAFN